MNAHKASRIFHLVDSAGMYGIEHVLLDLLPGLDKKGIPVLLGCLSPTGSPGSLVGEEAADRGIPVVFFNERKKISMRSLLAIRRTIEEAKVTMIHAHGYKATVLGGIVSFLTGLPLISTCHGEAAGHSEVSRYLRIEDFFLRRAALVVAVSERIRKELIGRGVPDRRIEVVYNGAADRFPVGHGEKNGAGSGFSPHILCVGRLVPVKRYDLVIGAFQRLRKSFPGAGLTIAGDGPLAEELRERTRMLGFSSAVLFPGFVRETGSLYDSADIFALSSDSEGTPMALIEAMSASLPIVTTAVGSVPELLVPGRDALVVPSGDLGARSGNCGGRLERAAS